MHSKEEKNQPKSQFLHLPHKAFR